MSENLKWEQHENLIKSGENHCIWKQNTPFQDAGRIMDGFNLSALGFSIASRSLDCM